MMLQTRKEDEFKVVVAAADLEAAQAEEYRAKKEWDRQQILQSHGSGAACDLDQAECDYKVAQAGVKKRRPNLRSPSSSCNHSASRGARKGERGGSL
jgi:multidrug resistance efflux pump